MKKLQKAMGIGVLLAISPMISWATIVTFNATGDPTDVTGFIQFDDSFFNGTSNQYVENTAITGLSLTVLGTGFGLKDVVANDFTLIDSTGNVPVIQNSIGLIADNGLHTISFVPDGYLGSVLDGDATLLFGFNLQTGYYTYHHVKWEANVVPIPTGVWLFGSGLISLIGIAKRKKV